MAQKTTLSIMPKVAGTFLLWACFQTALLAYIFDRWFRGASTISLDLLFTGVATGLGLVLLLLGVGWEYRVLCRLRERGTVVKGEIVSGEHWQKYSVAYSYDGVDYTCAGTMEVFDHAVRRTIRRAVSEKCPVQVLIDPAKPKRHLVLPFEE